MHITGTYIIPFVPLAAVAELQKTGKGLMANKYAEHLLLDLFLIDLGIQWSCRGNKMASRPI
jgi:hypothetical protein